MQFIPEIAMRFDESAREASLDQKVLDEAIEDAKQNFQEVSAQLTERGDVAYASVFLLRHHGHG